LLPARWISKADVRRSGLTEQSRAGETGRDEEKVGVRFHGIA
jgi:hypothetical protein